MNKIKLNNKGFTLIELMVAIAILAVIMSVTVISIVSVIKNSKNDSYKILVENIKTGAQEIIDECEFSKVGGNNYYVAPGGINTICSSFSSTSTQKTMTVTLNNLIQYGFLKINAVDNSTNSIITNPVTGENIGCCKIKITKNISSNKVDYSLAVVAASGCNVTCPTY